ncbi:MAG: metallophosphoesterase [Polyangiaceae bacterium]
MTDKPAKDSPGSEKTRSRAMLAVVAGVVAIVCYLLFFREPQTPKEPPPTPSSPTTAAAVPMLSPLVNDAGAPVRIVAVGDLHGDLAATRTVLKLAGAIDEKDKWVGGELVLVQTGDEIDRGDDDRAILDLFDRLSDEAKAAGGRVVPLNGNHELMNAQEDFRYVTKGAMDAFEDQGGRKKAFAPGSGKYAKLIAKRDVIGVIGDTVFVHGGLLPRFARDIQAINEGTKGWLRGEGPLPNAITDEHGPVWSRDYAEENGCAKAKEALRLLGARRMVIGHTVQKDGIQSACEGRVHRIDVGLSKFYGGAPQALEIRGDAVRVLK